MAFVSGINTRKTGFATKRSIEGIPPSNTVAPLLSGEMILGTLLSCTEGTWTGDLPITYAYQWKRDSVDIGGATNSTYTVTGSDLNFAITCLVTATNAFGSASQLSSNSIVFEPLDLSPTFWFNYTTYPIGAITAGVLDETGNYAITPINGALIGNDGVNNALSTNGASNNYAVSYGSTFTNQFKNPHTVVFLYKPKTVSRPFDAICGVDDGLGMQYTIAHFGQKIRLFIKISGVNNIFDTVNNVITNTNYLFILVQVQQSGVVIEINGVVQPLTTSAFVSTLANLNIVGDNLYTGARNNNNVLDSPSNCFIGQHLLIPSILTTEQKTALINYFT